MSPGAYARYRIHAHLMRKHGVPSMPVHDSLIVSRSRMEVALDVLRDRFRVETGMLPRLDINDPWNF